MPGATTEEKDIETTRLDSSGWDIELKHFSAGFIIGYIFSNFNYRKGNLWKGLRPVAAVLNIAAVVFYFRQKLEETQYKRVRRRSQRHLMKTNSPLFIDQEEVKQKMQEADSTNLDLDPGEQTVLSRGLKIERTETGFRFSK